jgi:hypothetical protein
MTFKAAGLYRFMNVLPGKIGLFMTLKTACVARSFEQHGILAVVGFMADVAVTFFNRLMDSRTPKPALQVLVATVTEPWRIIPEKQTANNTMRPVTGSAVILLDRVVNNPLLVTLA